MGYPEGLFPNLILVGMVKLLLNGDEKEVLSICPQHRVWGAKLSLVSCLAWQALPYIVLCWKVNSESPSLPSYITVCLCVLLGFVVCSRRASVSGFALRGKLSVLFCRDRCFTSSRCRCPFLLWIFYNPGWPCCLCRNLWWYVPGGQYGM